MATEVKKAVDLGLLEEDDEFEEFPAEKWEAKDEDPTDVNVWEDNWDDDTVEDDFSIQLSKYQRKRKHSHSPPLRSPEPTAKKIRATGNTPPDTCGAAAATTNGLSNGNSHSQNGSSLGSQEENNTSMDSSPAQRTPTRRRNTNRDNTPEPPPVARTRSSTRLRSNKK
jgi:hypothetical protein